MEIDETIKSVIGELNVPNKDLSLDGFVTTNFEPRINIHNGSLPKGKHICIHGDVVKLLND